MSHCCNKERLGEKIKTFSQFGATGNGGITRLSLSPAALEARAEYCRRAQELGLKIEFDDMGNIYATKAGTENLPRIVTGSHCDSVVCGGNYDGILGTLAGLEVVETLVRDKIETRHPVTCMIWTNEEGARFPPAMMSSGVITGKFSREQMLTVKDSKGITFGEALKASGYEGDIANRLDAKKYKAMLELHIEQGPVLEEEKKEIGVVEGVVGMVNYSITTRGQSDHAGTTPVKNRRDALRAAALMINRLYDEFIKLDPELVFTFGYIDCHPNVHTVIPDLVNFSVDARHRDPAVILQVVEVIKALPKEVIGCSVSYKENWGRKTILFDPQLVGFVQKNADAMGYSNRKIYSGAGHDAQYVQEVIPTVMIFVPSKDGHSHCEPEFTSLDECLKGANILLQSILDVDKT